jgi:hypothetical protein
MAYKKWVSNRTLGDGTTELRFGEDPGDVIRQGVPVEISAEDVKKYEDKFGFVFADSSAEEAKAYAESQQGPLQVPGGDVRGAAPTFVNAGDANQQTDQAESGKSGSGSKS